jgi:hypothetical protein
VLTERLDQHGRRSFAFASTIGNNRDKGPGLRIGVLVMMLRPVVVAALTLTGSGVACAQSVYLYVAPGASVYVTPTPNGPYYNGAPAVHPGPYPGPYAPSASVYAPTEVTPEVYVTPAPAYAPTYGAPLQAYGAARGIVMQRRVYLDEAPRPPAPVPYGWRGAR